ncbi:zinc knuckle CX2CX4HX4C containing protein [Tanacetum coccineum]
MACFSGRGMVRAQQLGKYGLKKVTLVKGFFFFFQFSSTEGVDSVITDGPWMIHGVSIFLNKWSSSVSLLNKELSRVPVWVKFHDVPLVAYTSDGLSLIAIKIGTPMMVDSYTNSIDNLVMVVTKFEEPGYIKETIHVEYEWKPPCCSTCLIFGHSVDDCPNAPKRVVNRVDKVKGGSSRADDEGFIEVKNKKSGGNNRGTKNFKPASVKPKTQYRPKVNQTTTELRSKTASFVGKKNVSTSCNSSKKTNMTNGVTSSNGIFSLSNLFEALNVDDPVTMELESSNKASTSGSQEEGNSSTPLFKNIHREVLVGKSIKTFKDVIEDESQFVTKLINDHLGSLAMLTKCLMRVEEEVDWWTVVGDLRDIQRKDEEIWEVWRK